jgi:hypothetical protein
MSTGIVENNNDSMAAVANLPREIAVIKMENESIQAMAAARPRDYRSIAGEIKTQLELFPAFAKTAIYAKPVGKDESGRQKIARNLSVRAAEAIAEAYGYCRIRTNVEVVEGNPDVVRVEAIFVDYQKGKVWEDSGLLSKWYKDRNGKMQRTPDDRFFNVTVRAELSKRVREVILRSVAPGLRLELFDMAEKVTASLLDETAVKAIIDFFGKQGVTTPQIEEYLGRKLALGWTVEDKLNLHGLVNAIKDGETTLADAFNLQAESQGKVPKTVNDLKPAVVAPAPKQAVPMPEAFDMESFRAKLQSCKSPDDITALFKSVDLSSLSPEDQEHVNDLGMTREREIIAGK